MDIRVCHLLLAAAESDDTVESGHICPLRQRRPTRFPALFEWPAGPLRWPVADGDTSVRCGYQGGLTLRPQRTSSPALHSQLHGPSTEAILVRRTWRRGFNFRLSGSATRRRQRGEGDEGVALLAYVEPRCFTASVCARAEPSNRALEVSPWTDSHLR